MIFTDPARKLLEAPLSVPDAIHQVGRSLWLYLWLLDNANAKGFVCRTTSKISQALSVPEAELLDWLSRLVAVELVETQSTPPYLVMKLRFWSGGAAADGHDSAEIGAAGVPHNGEVLESKLSLQAKASNEAGFSKQIGEGGVGEGGGDLLAEIRSAIGSDDGLDDLLTRYPESVIRTALAKTRATPDEQIKKSRAALFWFLIRKHTPDHAHP